MTMTMRLPRSSPPSPSGVPRPAPRLQIKALRRQGCEKALQRALAYLGGALVCPFQYSFPKRCCWGSI